jgi:hypothetical protein
MPRKQLEFLIPGEDDPFLERGIMKYHHDQLTGAKRREWMGCWGLLG